jgi:hypothetical protein
LRTAAGEGRRPSFSRAFDPTNGPTRRCLWQHQPRVGLMRRRFAGHAVAMGFWPWSRNPVRIPVVVPGNPPCSRGFIVGEAVRAKRLGKSDSATRGGREY